LFSSIRRGLLAEPGYVRLLEIVSAGFSPVLAASSMS
jgi:hypothetical protein